MSKLLLVEDDLNFAQNLMLVLHTARFAVDHADSARDAEQFLETYSYDLAVLDWELPDESGPELCKKIKEKYPHIPVLMLTGKTGIENTVFGLDAGSDDYVQKPCSTEELLARMRALLRRPGVEDSEDLSCGAVRIVESKHQAEVCGISVDLSPREYELLRFFIKHPDTHFNSDALFLRVWPSRTEISTELVRMYVRKLRQKIIDIANVAPIETVAGKGYLFSSRICHELNERNQNGG